MAPARAADDQRNGSLGTATTDWCRYRAADQSSGTPSPTVMWRVVAGSVGLLRDVEASWAMVLRRPSFVAVAQRVPPGVRATLGRSAEFAAWRADANANALTATGPLWERSRLTAPDLSDKRLAWRRSPCPRAQRPHGGYRGLDLDGAIELMRRPAPGGIKAIP
jgi:hypothetical protein